MKGFSVLKDVVNIGASARDENTHLGRNAINYRYWQAQLYMQTLLQKLALRLSKSMTFFSLSLLQLGVCFNLNTFDIHFDLELGSAGVP